MDTKKDRFVSRRDENIVHVDFPAAKDARRPAPVVNPFHALDFHGNAPLLRRVDAMAPWIIKLAAGILILILSLLVL